MLNGTDIRNVPWTDGDYSEIDAFVSEELYIHSKVLIADDRVVIVGSANLNDRSQLGDHDSEIAVVIEDPNHIESWMDGRPHRAARFAATLRRQLFRKHLGLLKPQDMEQQNDNFMPIGVPNWYDYGSSEDRMVTDPTADGFLDFWNTRKSTTAIFFTQWGMGFAMWHPCVHHKSRSAVLCHLHLGYCKAHRSSLMSQTIADTSTRRSNKHIRLRQNLPPRPTRQRANMERIRHILRAFLPRSGPRSRREIWQKDAFQVHVGSCRCGGILSRTAGCAGGQRSVEYHQRYPGGNAA